MIKFILAGVLGATSFIVVLLFRRLRRLNRQLQLRVERDSERIMRAISAQNPPSADGQRPQPGRQITDLAVHQGGATAAQADNTGPVRRLLTTRAAVRLGSTVVVAATAAVLIVAKGPQDGDPPPALPSVTASEREPEDGPRSLPDRGLSTDPGVSVTPLAA